MFLYTAAHLNLSSDSTVINTSLNKTSDEVIGIADLFGFENTTVSKNHKCPTSN